MDYVQSSGVGGIVGTLYKSNLSLVYTSANGCVDGPVGAAFNWGDVGMKTHELMCGSKKRN